MPDKIAQLKTISSCEAFIKNAIRLGKPDLEAQARRQLIHLKAIGYGCSSEMETSAVEAVFAYEEVLTELNGKKTRANRTWQMINKHGITKTIERVVNRPSETKGYTALVDKGLESYAFEAVVLKYPESFTEETIQKSSERLSKWKLTDKYKNEEVLTEGSSATITVNKYERNHQARLEALEHHGCTCKACDFNFEDRYGELGAGFIHVHHTTPLSEIGKSYTINPITDLIPLCPNCHAMVHQVSPPMPVSELRTLIKSL